MQYNLAVGFALKEDWEKANNLMGQLYKEGQEVSVQVRTEKLILGLTTEDDFAAGPTAGAVPGAAAGQGGPGQADCEGALPRRPRRPGQLGHLGTVVLAERNMK